MLMEKRKKLIVIVGPTAIGKTDVAIQLAKRLNTEIVSADSRQFYQEMSIGTARPSETELNAVPHHFIASHSISQPYSAGDFETEGLKCIETLFETHNHVILVGGSGLFIKAITEGFDTLPKANETVRASLNQSFEEKGIGYIQDLLREKDPVYYTQVDTNNPQRLIRALEVCLNTGIPFSQYRLGTYTERPFKTIKIGLNTDRAVLYNRINKRVDVMIEMGLLEEVKGLLPMKELNALNTVGYSEIFDHFEGKLSLDDAIAAIKQNTRRFAKRQITWFKKDISTTWFEPSDTEKILAYIDLMEKRDPSNND